MAQDSIKKRIMDRVVTRLTAMSQSQLPDGTTVRSVTREVDPLADMDKTPALMVYDGPETFVEEDERGRTFEFTLGVKVLIKSERNLAATKDVLVPAVQACIESDLQLDDGDSLGRLVNCIEGGEEQPFLSEIGKPSGGAFLTWSVQYRRYKGDPYRTY